MVVSYPVSYSTATTAAHTLAAQGAEPSKGSRRTVMAAVSAAAFFMLAAAVVTNSYLSSPKQDELDQHLMSSFSRFGTEMKAHDSIFETEGHTAPKSLSAWTGRSSHTFDTLKDVSSRPVKEAEDGIQSSIRTSESHGHHQSWFGKWGDAENYFAHSDSESSAMKWQNQLQKLKEAQEARRKREDARYFAGVSKAFGKKAGLAMMDAFDGKSSSKSESSLAKIKIDDQKLKERKDDIAHNQQLPQAHKQDKIAATIKAAEKKDDAHGKLAKKAAAAHTQHKEAVQNGVKEALKVAKEMHVHKDPVAKTAVKKEVKKVVVKKKFDLHHPGVVSDTKEIKKLVHEFHHAHGEKKKQLKARVMQLQQSIVNDFAKVTEFGQRAKTAFQRAEAKTAKKKAVHHHDMSDESEDDD